MGTAEPPVAAMLLAPVAVLPLAVAGWLLAPGRCGRPARLALIALAGPVARRYGTPRWPAVLVAGGLALATEPVRATLGSAASTCCSSAWSRPMWWRCAEAHGRAAGPPGGPAHRSGPPGGPTARHARPAGDLLRRGWATGAWAGVGTGIATALAVSPALFIAYLALTRQWRAAFTALGTAASLVACAAC